MDDFFIREFIKRYSRTVAILKVKGFWKSVFINDSTTNDAGEKFILIDSDGKSQAIPVKELAVKSLKHRVCFNFNHVVYIFSRTTVRQWKKGFTSDNTVLKNGLSVVLENNTQTRYLINRNFRDYGEVTSDAFSKLLDTSYPNSIKLAVDKLSQINVQTCINDEYWVSMGFERDYYLLCRFDVVVGVYSRSGDSVTPITPIYRQELLDLVTRNNLTTRVL